MKKILFSLGLALGLLGLTTATAQAQLTELVPWHINTYDVASTTGTFTDISDNPNAVALNATGTSSLFDGVFCATDDGDATPTFYNNATANTLDDAEGNTHFGFPLGFEFNFCGQKMTHFSVSALGGVFFSQSAQQGDHITTQLYNGRWTAWAVPFIFTSATATTTTSVKAGQAIAAAGKAAAYYLIEGSEGNHVLTTQHDYLVGAGSDKDEWIFQFKFYEATGKVEFISKQLPCDNAFTTSQGKYHRIMLSLMDYATTTNSTETSAILEANDPYGAKYLNLKLNGNAGNHKVFPSQTNEMSEANGWANFNLAYTAGAYQLSEASTMRVDGNTETGRTIGFTPKTRPETLAALTEEDYAISGLSTTGSTINVNISFNEENFPSTQALQEAGSIVAIISQNETPDYTLQDGTWYQKGHQFDESDGFKPTVLCNQMPTAQSGASYPHGYKIQSPVAVTANKLMGRTTYYIHLYRMSFIGTDAPVYSPLCHTITATTTFSLPEKLETVGLADIDAVKVKAAPADGMSVLIVKSKSLNVKPSGQLKKGDKIGDAEVVELLSQETTFDVPMAENEGCFILAFSANTDDPDNYSYTEQKLYIPVGTAYNGLPGLIDFTHLPYGVPNLEYNGIDIRDRSFSELEPTIYRDLPFGYTRTDVANGNKDAAFGIGQPSYEKTAPLLVYAKTRVPGMDIITPPTVANTNRIRVTFNIKYLTFKETDVINQSIPKKDLPLCDIEYAIGDGAWQKGVSIKCYDLPAAEDGYYPLSFNLIADDGQSFIGQKIRFRFISTYIRQQGSSGLEASFYVGIGSVDIKEDKLCQTVHAAVTNDELTSNTALSFTWNDPNTPAAPSYEIAYKPADDTSNNWLTRKSTDTVYTISGLKPITAYSVRVTADCGGTWGKAYASTTATLSTIRTFPYAENLAQDPKYPVIVGTQTVWINGQTPFERGVYAMTGELKESGYASLQEVGENTPASWSPTYASSRIIDNQDVANAVSIRETSNIGWLMMPSVFVPEFDYNFPQILRFKANSAQKSPTITKWTKGSIGTKYADAKLFILLSHNGKFSMEDTIATIAVGTETIDNRAFEFEVPENLLKEGRAQVAFYFRNPKGSDDDNNNDLMLFEIFDFEFDYSDGICPPISNLTRSNTTTHGATYSWEGYADHYKFFWGLRSGANYTDSITTKETTYTLSNLKDDTQYKVKVTGYCDEAETEITPGSQTAWFRTFEACHTPTDFSIMDITAKGATFSSTDDQDIMTQRLIYLTPEEGDTRIVVHPRGNDTLAVTGLLSDMVYTAQTRAVCNKDSSEWSEAITFKTVDSFNITLKILPNKNAGTVTGEGRYEKGQSATISATPAEGYTFVAWLQGNDTVSKEASYTFNVTADSIYTALFYGNAANEAAVKAAFNVSAANGHLYIRNLKGLTVEEVTIYGLTGRKLGHFTPNSREDLALPINAERALLLVRVASEQGVAIYKVYLH